VKDISFFFVLQRGYSFSLEKYMADQGFFESGFLRLDGSARKDPHLGQSQKKACHRD